METEKIGRAGKTIGYFAALCLIGAISGQVSAFLILCFGSLIGRSGTTGTEYWGYLNPAYNWWWAGWTGRPLGILLGPLGYYCFLQNTPLIRAWFYAITGTIISGCIGAILGPLIAAFTACIGYFSVCNYIGKSK